MRTGGWFYCYHICRQSSYCSVTTASRFRYNTFSSNSYLINVHNLLICPPLALQNFKPAVSSERLLSLSSNFAADAWKTSDHKGLFIACSVIACFTPQRCTGESKNPLNHALNCYMILPFFFCSFIRVAYASGSFRTQRSSNLSAVPS